MANSVEQISSVKFESRVLRLQLNFVANAMPTMIVEEELRELDRSSIFLRNNIKAGICGLNLCYKVAADAYKVLVKFCVTLN